MLKKTMLIAGVLAALAGMVMPAMANATAKNWTEGEKTIGASAVITTHGTAAFTSEQGGIACPTTATATIFPSPKGAGHLTAFGASPTSNCVYSGALDILCGVVNLHESTAGGKALSKDNPWTIQSTSFGGGIYGFTVANIEVHVDGTGVFCPNVTTHGNVTATTSNRKGSTFNLEGTLASNITEVVHVSGEQHVTPANTYELET